MILKEVPLNERPREKLLAEGVEKLSNTELIAILLRTGTKDKNVLELATKVVYLLEDISDLNELTIQELENINGIGEAKAITIVASAELGRRIASARKSELTFVTPENVYEYFYPRLKDYKQEVLYGIYMDVRGKVNAIKQLTVGTVNSTLIDPKIVFKWAYKYQASSIILVHNHPSGESMASPQDLKSTAELVKQARTLNFEIIDHIIIGNDLYSMKRMSKAYKVF